MRNRIRKKMVVGWLRSLDKKEGRRRGVVDSIGMVHYHIQ